MGPFFVGVSDMFKKIVLVTMIALLGGCASVERAFIPEPVLLEHWQAHDPNSTDALDHQPWGAFLETYLVKGSDGINRVAYGRVTEADRKKLDIYVTELAAAQVTSLNRDEQFSFWINLYNAHTVQTILNNYPVASIRDIGGAVLFVGTGPWSEKSLRIEDQVISLNDIEHRILRPIWNNPLIHYAVNCAALGCPNLRAEPFTPNMADLQLDFAARDFINHPRGVTVRGTTAEVSSIFYWYREDFGQSEQKILTHLRTFANEDLKPQLKRVQRISNRGYDWALNDARN